MVDLLLNVLATFAVMILVICGVIGILMMFGDSDGDEEP